MDHNLTHIHGSNVVQEGLALFDNLKLQTGDTVLLPSYYRLKYTDQTRPDYFRMLQEVEKFTCCKDFTVLA